MDKAQSFYPNFDHPASHLSAFSLCIDVFIISLKNGEIVKFKPDDIAHFKEWLDRFKVRDIAYDNGMPPDNRTSNSSKSNLIFFNVSKRNRK